MCADECFKYQDLKKIIREFNTPLKRISDQLRNVQDNLQGMHIVLENLASLTKPPRLKKKQGT